MNKNIVSIFLIFSLIFIFGVSSTTIGANQFYANFLLTNANYGFGAVFPCTVWFDGVSQQMRIDYFNTNGTKFMTVYYNYLTHDKYEVCGQTCSHATWNAAMPIFNGTIGINYATTACQTPDYPGPKACTNYPNCFSALSSPNEPQGIYSLSYTDSAYVNLCLVRFTPATGDQYGPEWQISNYLYQSSQWNSTTNPTQTGNPNLYSGTIAGLNCPQPVCFATLDISLIVDESGSIFAASAWNDVQSFVLNLISALAIGPSGIRVGLAYFSGLNSCGCNNTGTYIDYNCAQKSSYYYNTCEDCGGTWSPLTVGLITSKSTLLSLANNHQAYKGFTCISCGIDVGIKMLNFAPKANVQKIIILFTDGAQNRITAGLVTNAKYAYDQSINIIAIGTGNYKLTDLQVFSKTIYTTAKFSQLTSLISSIITPLCQPLPNIDTCDFCSGLCSCTTTCNCPTCYNYNKCYTQNCNVNPPPVGTLGICVSVPITCDDNNPCTINNCINTTGCDYSQPTPLPSGDVQTFCQQYICSNPQGFVLTDIGSTQCPSSSNLCIINYCNTTLGTTNGLKGSCISINRSSSAYPSGTSISYTTSSIPAQTITVAGCGTPTNALPCQQYYCNTTSGNCVINTLNCVCQTNTDCNDGNGCTNDVCNTTLNKCIYTNVDCYSILSNGTCTTNGAYTASNATGVNFYNGGTYSVNSTNGLPSPSTGVSRTCDQLACWAGLKSTYTCQSTGNYSSVCVRQTSTCGSTACSDTACSTSGGWTNNQVNTACGATFSKPCTSGSLCAYGQCNTTWTGSTCTASGSCASTSGGIRCLSISNATNCVTSNVCVTTGCNSTSGCITTPLGLPTPNYCLSTGCNPSTGNYSNVNASVCTNSNLCIVPYCNTTLQQCIYFNKTSMLQTNTTYYVDAYGNLQSVTGCYAPHPCIIYGCNPTTGQCTVNSSNCNCTSNTQCNDNNGCTADSCVNFACVNQPYDCWNISSNGGCYINNVTSETNATGYANYLLGSPVASFTVGTYNCDQLACYSGQRSQYTCQNISSSSFQCVRTTANCAKGGCTDTICRTLGTWSGGQLNTDCGATVSPVCISNACGLNSCNTSYVYGSGNARCIYTSNSSSCTNGGNLCVSPVCVNTTGCGTLPVPSPSQNTTCTIYTCSASQGWQPTNVGPINCNPNPSNLCVINYCNTTTNACTSIDKTTFPVGTTQYYIDSDGNTYSVTGCAKPSSDTLKCRTYGCDTPTGTCTTSTSNCNCIDNASCQDGNGCTIDVCDTNLNQCNRTNIDCFSILSNGTCTTNGNYTPDILTGLNIYYGNASANNVYTQVDSNQLPYPNTGVSRTCGQLGCYAGQPSNYTCFSTNETTYQCQRYTLNCNRNGCQDNICRTLGGWNGQNQLNTDCGTIYRPNCANANACYNNFCNSSWVPSQNASLRCIHQPINATQYCDDGNFCTYDYCDSQSTSGNICKHNLYSQYVLRTSICQTNNSLICQTIQCTVNKCLYNYIQCLPSTLCIYYTCNASTNGTCQPFPTGIYTIDKCGICGGNGLSCIPDNPVNPKKTSIIVALAVGLGVGLCFAALIIGILSKTGYSAYQALAVETMGTVQTAPTYKGGENEFTVGNHGD